MTAFVTEQPQKPNLLVQIATVVLSGGLVFIVVTTAITGIAQVLHAGRIMAGVHMAGLDLSGMPPAQAAESINQNLTYPNTGRIVLRDGDLTWLAAPEDLGMTFDVGSSVEEAYQVGRGSGLFGDFSDLINTRLYGINVQPVVVLDERVAFAYLQNLAAQIDVPVREADLHLNGTAVVYNAGQTGRNIDIAASLSKIIEQLQTFRDGEVDLVIRNQEPEIRDASAKAELLRLILNQPFILSITSPEVGDPGPLIIDTTSLAGMIRIDRFLGQYQVTIDPQEFTSALDELAAQIDHDPVNARFIFNDSTLQLDLLEPAISGRKLDITATLEMVQTALFSSGHQADLVIKEEQPAVGSDATAASLGITGLVSEQSTYFRGSSAERLQNILIAKESFHGLLIAPYETFSMGEVLGDVSLENGYREAMIIYNGRTIKGVGGGVCQVSTTLFRTAFFGGYPIVARTPHAYRVRYYEQTEHGHDSSLAGLDATVYFPLVDFKFTNDRPSYLLMEVYVSQTAQRITWKFYSSDDGRRVDMETTGPMNVVPAPEPLFQLNPELGQNEISQIDWPADGADITVTRTVIRAGALLISDVFQTHYLPWQAVCEYGPGTDDWVGQAELQGLCQAP